MWVSSTWTVDFLILGIARDFFWPSLPVNRILMQPVPPPGRALQGSGFASEAFGVKISRQKAFQAFFEK
ncbi:MAG: hypothetical protein JXR70_11540, partial [Spirochaetales bacterium]|nr:hypothetical protein [Spirochaetales bacterium]